MNINEANIDNVSNYETGIEGIFAAEDAVTGASLVCRGINNDKQAAAATDECLMFLVKRDSTTKE